jgi:hypothetical protein
MPGTIQAGRRCDGGVAGSTLDHDAPPYCIDGTA